MDSDFVVFKMWGKRRERLIYETKFYLKQAEKRLLCQFENKENEANDASEQWLKDNSARFNPDVHDGADFMEEAGEAGNDLYELLSEMEKSTKLSVAASLFHEWNKQLRDWLIREIMHWHNAKNDASKRSNVENEIWKQNFDGIIELIEKFIPDIKNTPYYSLLNQCRLVVNVFKHGDGGAFDNLKSNHPEYLKDWFETASSNHLYNYKDYTALNVSHNHIRSFSKAITEFWEAIPENVFASQITKLPTWFEKAFKKDLESAKGGRM